LNAATHKHVSNENSGHIYRNSKSATTAGGFNKGGFNKIISKAAISNDCKKQQQQTTTITIYYQPQNIV
jgi:hypothetical protein